MAKNIFSVILILTLALLFALPVSADYEALSSPVIGSWVLDKVYENASTADRTVLDPESSASLYAEKDNIYAFLADGTAEMTMEGVTSCGFWEKQDGSFRMVINSTNGNSDKTVINEPDIDPLYEMEYIYDEDQNVLHRYWQDNAPDAYYHDLDFVYKQMPQGIWMMTSVYSREPGKEPQLLDPETSQSLYAESVNRLSLFRYEVINMVPAETEYINETGELKRSGDGWLLEFEDGFETQLHFDDRAGVLHRYWADDAADGGYLDLDFVYEMIPVGSWHLKYVYDLNGEQGPVFLGEEEEPELYQETGCGYIFGPDGRASAGIPDEVPDEGEWSGNNGEIRLRFDDGREMVFAYDAKADVLHRYQAVDDPDAGHQDLDFVYLKD